MKKENHKETEEEEERVIYPAPWVMQAMAAFTKQGMECRLKTPEEARADARAMDKHKPAWSRLSKEERMKQVAEADRLYATGRYSKPEACEAAGISHGLYKRLKSNEKKGNK